MIETHELSRRAGSQREVSFTAVAPADLGIDVIGVPEGDPIQFDLRLEAVVEGVLVTGSASGRLVGECARCLVDVEDEFLADVQELYVYPESEAEPDEASRMEGDLIDLEPALRDQVVLALPFQPLCSDDCPGLCPECGVRLVEEPGHKHDDAVDARWSALGGLLQNDSQGKNDN
ncbi:YceD family protein [Kribbella antibiotica]|uniref:YceD family protein n=1 Tax=Kribbella antibiotica TaxID=190195 RepID=UPI00192E09D5|nr:YceD family protein [Kribbella antibiotica]